MALSELRDDRMHPAGSSGSIHWAGMADDRRPVTIAHPDVPNPGRCSRWQFHRLWEAKGWQITHDEDGQPVKKARKGTKPQPADAQE